MKLKRIKNPQSKLRGITNYYMRCFALPWSVGVGSEVNAD